MKLLKLTYHEKLTHIKNIFIKTCGVEDFDKTSRKREYVYLRFIFMKLCDRYTDATLGLIGMYCGNRDHATVLYGLKEFEHHLDKNYFNHYLKIYSKCVTLLSEEPDFHFNELINKIIKLNQDEITF